MRKLANAAFMKRRLHRSILRNILSAGICFLSFCHSAHFAQGEPKKGDQFKSKPSEGSDASESQRNCAAIASAASEARNVLQRKQLTELEQQVRQRLSELEIKKTELQALLDRHEALLRKTDEAIVDVYSRMRPEAAAAQLINLDEESAASLLMQLRPKNASAILNEIDATHAATIVKKMMTLSPLVRNDKKP